MLTYLIENKDKVVLLFILLSLVGLIKHLADLQNALTQIDQLSPSKDNGANLSEFPKISVIVPAYNEADNIEDCVTSILNSTSLLSEQLEVWIVDDESTDETLKILQNLQQNLEDPRLKILPGLPRPEEKWMGKNWACAQGAKCSKGEFLLFIDADVRLKPVAIETVVQTAITENIDLLNCIPKLICGFLAEWLVQPLIFINLLISLNSKDVKNPKKEEAFAGGFFMLFKRSAYEQVGGHRTVASHVAEDVALARLIKGKGLKLGYRLGVEIATLRMYHSFSALWEGWTKVLYVGAQQNFLVMIGLALLMLIIYSIPWLELVIILGKNLTIGLGTIDLLTVETVAIAIILQYKLRKLVAKGLDTSTKYWWLNSLGGLLVAVMAIASVIKTETGWGWTWRGRFLKKPIHPSP